MLCIVLTGTREVLEETEKAINQCNDGSFLDHDSANNWVRNLFDVLHVNTKRWNPNRAFWHHAHFNKHGHLVSEEHSAWERSKCAEALKQRLPQEISGINYHYAGWC